MSDKRQTNPAILFIIGGILLIVSAVWITYQNIEAAQTSTALSEEEIDALVPRISLNDAKAALDTSAAIFLDVRSAEAYQESHIKGAVNIPLAELEARIGELDPNQWIVTYCT